MHGIHKDREAFRFKKRRKNAKAKAVKKKQAEFGLPQLVIEEYHAAVIEDDYSDGSQILEFDQMLEAAPNQWLGENNAHSVVALYTRAQLTKPQAIQLLQLYRMRHKLTDAGFEDLLELLNRSLLPANNTLPRTLYSFNKALDEDCVLRVQHRTKNFVVFNIRSQIADVIKRNFSSFTKHRSFIAEKENLYDFGGKLIRENLDDFISLSIFTDGAPIAISSNVQMWPVICFILDLPPKLQKSIENVIWIGLHVSESTPNWAELFSTITPQFTDLLEVPLTLHFDGVVAVQSHTYKVRVLEILADNIGRADILLMKKPPGYFCCPICLAKGKWDAQAGTVVYPESVTGIRMRCGWIPDNNNGKQNGIRALTPLAEFMALPQATQVDCMHTVYAGIFKWMIHAIYKKSQLSQAYFDDMSVQMHRPREIKRGLRQFKNMAQFKTNEFKTILHFIMPTALPNFADFGKEETRMTINCLLLICGMHTLASKNLTENGIKFAHRVLQHWHKTLESSFGRRFLTFKAHQVVHLAHSTIKHGSCVHRTCFSGESCVGFALQRISCPNNALWQISERIKRIPANALDLTTKEWFSTTKQNFGQEFVRTIEDLRDSDANHQEIHQILIGRYPNENILMSKQIQLEHFILRSRALVGNFKDSLVFVQSAHDQSLHPVIVEVFYKIDDTIRALVRELKIETTFSDSLRWIRGDQTAFDLLTNRRAFANCCVVASEAGELFNVRAERIISKGLIVQNSDKLFAFPLFAFDHD